MSNVLAFWLPKQAAACMESNWKGFGPTFLSSSDCATAHLMYYTFAARLRYYTWAEQNTEMVDEELHKSNYEADANQYLS